ncbi:N-acetylmuramoyl-L-alanine amidase [candidate division KSB1 bacterium]|nr:N-acetylmuramoyl-L-alanine amidase [candidate division KSB1 bacterium]
MYSLLRRYLLKPNNAAVDRFWQLNSDQLKKGRYLHLHQEYKLPVYIVYYDGVSIRSSIGVNDMALARRIQAYNEQVVRHGLKKKSYRVGKELWVPRDWIKEHIIAREPTIYSLFGRHYEAVRSETTLLRGMVYYLDAGHGGPDPGAIGKRGKSLLYEDEYAYDITLRLACRLLQQGARVYMIVQDEDDGIRDEALLRPDHDESYYGGVAISDDHFERLSDRTEIINTLYEQHQSHARDQILITLHVDSRSRSKRVDIFYYYQKNNPASKKLATILLQKIEEKYSKKQPGRGYQGTMGTRNLFVLSEAKPTAVYIEVGNIKNSKDQDRLIIADNRQAVANWLCEGLIKAAP